MHVLLLTFNQFLGEFQHINQRKWMTWGLELCFKSVWCVRNHACTECFYLRSVVAWGFYHQIFTWGYFIGKGVSRYSSDMMWLVWIKKGCTWRGVGRGTWYKYGMSFTCGRLVASTQDLLKTYMRHTWDLSWFYLWLTSNSFHVTCNILELHELCFHPYLKHICDLRTACGISLTCGILLNYLRTGCKCLCNVFMVNLKQYMWDGSKLAFTWDRSFLLVLTGAMEMMIVFMTVLYMWAGSQLHSSRRSGKERKQPMFLDLVFVCIVQSIAGSVVTCEAQQLKSISVWWGSHKSVCEFVLDATWKRSLFWYQRPMRTRMGGSRDGGSPKPFKIRQF